MSENDSAGERAGRVRIRLPTGEDEWVTPEAFNLISEREFLDSHRLRVLRLQRNGAVASAALLALLMGAALLTNLRGQGGVAADAAVQAAVATAPEPAAPEASEAPPSPPAEGGPPQGATAAVRNAAAARVPDAGVLNEIEATVRAWADAWSAQDVDRYLGFYSPAFQVPDGLSRAAWEALRRERITAPASIAVTVSDVETTVTDAAAVARFGQGYRAPGYRDWVAKTLVLAREAGGWRIVEERSALIEAAPGG